MEYPRIIPLKEPFSQTTRGPRLAMGRTLCIAAGFLAVASSLRVVTTPLRHCTVQPRRAVISASATNTTRLLEECAKGERSLSLINSAVAALEQDEVPKKLGKALLGDWQLAFAGDQEAADMLLASKAGPLLTIEGALLCFNKRDEMRAIEVSRPFGPFSNKRKVLEGRWGLEKTGEVRFRYTYLMEGRSRREEDVPESAKGTQIAKVAAGRRPPPFSRRPLPAVCFLQPAARSPQPAARSPRLRGFSPRASTQPALRSRAGDARLGGAAGAAPLRDELPAAREGGPAGGAGRAPCGRHGGGRQGPVFRAPGGRAGLLTAADAQDGDAQARAAQGPAQATQEV